MTRGHDHARVDIRYATDDDIPWLLHMDDASSAWVRRCVAQREYLVADLDGKLVGFLRHSWFWGAIPYMDMVRVQENCRGRGVGRSLFHRWEAHMRRQGATSLLTSSVEDEVLARRWHEKNGFEFCGRLDIDGKAGCREDFLRKSLDDPPMAESGGDQGS